MVIGTEACAAVALLVWFHGVASPPAGAEGELSESIGAHELRAHVYRLAGPEFLGRRGLGAVRAAEHLADAFRRVGLRPGVGDSYFQEIPWLVGAERRRSCFLGRNVVGVVPGSDPELRDEWILLGAHYDHLGKDGGLIFPGADDNASGVAMLQEVAERFALRKERPRRTVVFVAFDQEEAGLLGSTHFAAHPPRDFKKLKACLIADMLGRSMADVMEEYVFALGAETSSRWRRLLDEVRPEPGLRVGRLGADVIGTRSDYGPFRDRRVPFLFFSTGQHADYHRPTDTPEKLDYAKLARVSRWIGDLAARLADDPEAPAWEESTEPDLAEARLVLTFVGRVIDRAEGPRLTAGQREQLMEVRQRLRDILSRGRVTDGERTWLVWTARFLLATTF